MAAPEGNRFWEARSRHGRFPIFKTPEQLWEAATDYFTWVEDNPLYEDKTYAYEGDVTHEPVAKMRAMTIAGLCIFLDISHDAWEDYRKREDFGVITARVDRVIKVQKFEGASANMLNANIIARDLGLADKSEITGSEGGPIKTENVIRPSISRAEWLALHAQGDK